MKPGIVASELRRIASLIDASNAPRRDRVALDLKRLIANLAKDPSYVEFLNGVVEKHGVVSPEEYGIFEKVAQELDEMLDMSSGIGPDEWEVYTSNLKEMWEELNTLFMTNFEHPIPPLPVDLLS